MLESERTTVNGIRYEVTKLPYRLGHRVLLRLYKVVGPALAKALSAVPETKGKKLLDLQVGDLAPAISAAVEKLAEILTEEDFDFVVDSLASYTKVSRDGEKWPELKSEMEFLFAGNYGEMLQWLGFALRVNFGGFFGGQKLGDLLSKAAAKVNQSQNTSIGTSTVSPVPSITPQA